MLKILFIFIMIFLCAIGLADVTLYIKRRIYRFDKKKCAMAAFIPADCSCDGEFIARCVKSSMDSFCRPGKSVIFIIDNGADEETIGSLRQICDTDYVISPDCEDISALSNALESIIKI